MENIAKRLKKLRLEKRLTQDDLARRLHVTRQAVSNWETCKTVVGIEYLMKLGEIYGVSVDELLHGEWAAEPEVYPQNQRKYMVTLTICAGAILLCSLLNATLKPMLLQRYRVFFEVWPYMTYVHLAPAVMGAALGVAIPAIASLHRDIRLWGRWRQLVMVFAVLWLIPVAMGLIEFVGWVTYDPNSLWRWLTSFSSDVWWNLSFYGELFFLSGLCFFLGLNR